VAFNIKDININDLELWISNLVDVINYNSSLAESAVPALVKALNQVDTAPLPDLRHELILLVKSINTILTDLQSRIERLEQR
jgi:hypothetical protein